ncbi:hypothetical protein FHX80_111524 [Streptomyces brevispora]|uniref:Response regulator receiver domain-containing protein n=1 Tax=Streptomyces brevispora TaxID=887462 RepID=A0A561UUT5_9ACTN|nr:hypothetical protein [Streptomyces brevispora]TWG03107.1 hypothetical protein FHX80_111524 [Streptomyces brevispora]
MLRALNEYRPDSLILSLRLPGLDPWEVLSRVRNISDLPIAVRTWSTGCRKRSAP